MKPTHSRSGEPLVALLAGFSRRMGQPKQHAMLGGSTFLERLLATAEAVSPALGPRLFVGQEGDDRSRRLIEERGGTWLVNPRPEDGPLGSIRIAIAHLPSERGFLLWPVDHPLVGRPTVELLLAEARRHPEAIVVPSHAMRRGHPARFPARARPELLRGPLEAGAKFVLQEHPDWIRHVETDDPWTVRNLNSPDLLALAEAWLAEHAAI